ncbi:carotenoid biosynthesis protein [Halobacillus sp. ACCC02827]|uniref:carotenoid biosynthesis protein n=1 Tax=Bacillaceae TaxID=186817 RepID=UPI0002A4D85E|nr:MULTISPECIES: carotenoid biosynthesis protein [Bacillaceae]ELK44586.1 hypothetical protein D479_18529 [Halobacillus sp. BAB-2008]QHT46463.1 carotenoid biosynthesis protein [Bacillus sp. SB49]WJE17273.1 carotenoid biosynthesis protein [Halobacillus sp. ACCC02827]
MTTIIYRFFLFWYACGLILVTFDILPPWLEWANSVFLITAGVVGGIYFCKMYGTYKGLLYSIIIVVVSIYVEHLGVEQDFLFGSYTYNDNFGLKIADTPITIGFAWLLVMGCSHEMARGITSAWKGPFKNISFLIIGSLVTVTMDLILDPVNYKIKEYWLWDEPGLYYDIPASNFVGWFVLSAVFHLIFLLWSPKPLEDTGMWPKRMSYVFLMIVFMFLVVALTGGLFFAITLVTILTVIWYVLYKWRDGDVQGST